MEAHQNCTEICVAVKVVPKCANCLRVRVNGSWKYINQLPFATRQALRSDQVNFNTKHLCPGCAIEKHLPEPVYVGGC